MAGEEENIDLQAMIRALVVDKNRMIQMMKTGNLTPHQIMLELAETVLPFLADLATCVDKIDEFCAYANDRLDGSGQSPDDSQLLPEDADKFRKFIAATRETSVRSLEQMAAGSAEHHALQVMIAGADELLQLVDEIELHEGDPTPAAPPLQPTN